MGNHLPYLIPGLLSTMPRLWNGKNTVFYQGKVLVLINHHSKRWYIKMVPKIIGLHARKKKNNAYCKRWFQHSREYKRINNLENQDQGMMESTYSVFPGKIIDDFNMFEWPRRHNAKHLKPNARELAFPTQRVVSDPWPYKIRAVDVY